ncbi:MAG: hypothetical protein QMB65_01400, partial [Vicingaceae bacterium]
MQNEKKMKFGTKVIHAGLEYDSATGAIRIIENADENTFIKVHATDKSTVTLRPFSTGTMQEVGDILQSYS